MAQYKRFAGYDKIEPSLNFFFHTGRIDHKKHWLSLSFAQISHRDYGTLSVRPQSYNSTRLRYNRTRNNALLKERIVGGLMYAQATNVNHWRAEASYERTDKISKKSKFKSKVYGGWISTGSSYFDLYSAGSPDVNKDYYLIDRVGNQRAGWLGSNQALMDQGGFMSANLRADNYMFSLNLEYQYKWYFHPYVHGLLVDEFMYYETGLGLSLGVLDVYFPLSSNVFVNGFPESGKQWAESVRFSLTLNLGSMWNQVEIQF